MTLPPVTREDAQPFAYIAQPGRLCQVRTVSHSGYVQVEDCVTEQRFGIPSWSLARWVLVRPAPEVPDTPPVELASAA